MSTVRTTSILTTGLSSLFLLSSLLFSTPVSDPLARARAAVAAGDLSSARSILKSLLIEEPDNAAALVLVGQILVESNEASEAISPLERVLDQAPRSGAALFWLWRAKQQAGTTKESDPYFLRALKSPPSHPELLYELAEEAYRRGLYLEATAAFRGMKDAVYLRVEYANLLAACLHARGDPRGALQVWRQAVSIKPDAGSHFGLGLHLFKSGQFDQARASFRRSLELSPTQVSSKFYLAKISESEGDLDRALETYREIIDLEPEHAESHAAIGRLALKKGQFVEAEEHLKRSVQLDASYRPARYNLGLLYSQLGEIEKAREELQRAEELRQSEARPAEGVLVREADSNRVQYLDPDSPALRTFRRGVDAHKKGEHKVAESAYLEVVRELPGWAEAHMNLGLLYHDVNRLDEAIPHLRTAIDLDPRLTVAHYFLGMDLYLVSQFEGALSSLEKAGHLAPETPQLQYWLGLTSLELGRLQEAVEHLEKHLEESPSLVEETNRALLRAYVQIPDRDSAWRTASVLAGEEARQSQVHEITARAYAEAGRPEQAIEHFREVVRLEGSEAPAERALLHLIDVYRLLGRPAEAEEASRALRAIRE